MSNVRSWNFIKQFQDGILGEERKEQWRTLFSFVTHTASNVSFFSSRLRYVSSFYATRLIIVTRRIFLSLSLSLSLCAPSAYLRRDSATAVKRCGNGAAARGRDNVKVTRTGRLRGERERGEHLARARARAIRLPGKRSSVSLIKTFNGGHIIDYL